MLPWHLQKWLTPVPLIDESHLNCGGCTRFKTKCCAFQPYIANYNARVLRASDNYWNLPIGIIASSSYRERYEGTPMHERGKDLLCVNYDSFTGQCGQWSRRSAECAAYHCESSRGAQGLESWQELSIKWNALEVNVAQLAMQEMGFDSQEVDLQVDWLNLPPREINLETAWAHWWKRETEFYKRCTLWAEALTVEQLMTSV